MNKLSKYTFISISILIVSSLDIFSATNYVSKAGAHIPPFDSWANAATNIQDAVYVASLGNLILVNDGIYYPANPIYVTNGVTVKSVNGAEKTIINGNNLSVYFYINENNILDDLTITNNNNKGVLCQNGGTVQNCTISGNSGNGVYCDYGGTVQNCTISGNSGNGVYCSRGGTVQSCTISGNFGSGVYCYKGGTVQNCTISGNTTYSGGGVFCDENSIVQNCTISGNSANNGGGVCCRGGTVQYCTISENTGTASEYGGGGVCCENGGVIQNCTIEGNSSDNNGGGVYCNDGTIKNCLITDNSANSYGGAIYVLHSATIVNNTIVRNFAGSKGGGIYNDSDNVIALYNSIVYGNMAAVDLQVNSNVVTHYSCVENGDLSNHCITNNPEFYSEFNFHFTEESPCINAGINLPNIWDETDLDGNPRVQGGTVDMGCYEGPIPEPGLFILSFFSLFFILKCKF